MVWKRWGRARRAAPKREKRVGSMASRNGSAIAAPIPRRTVLRESCFRMMKSMPRLLVGEVNPLIRGRSPHQKRGALDDSSDDRRPGVVGGFRITNDPAHGRAVEVLDAPSQRIGHQLF